MGSVLAKPSDQSGELGRPARRPLPPPTLTAAGRVGGAMAERAASARAAARRGCFQWAASADERTAARAALARGAQRLRRAPPLARRRALDAAAAVRGGPRVFSVRPYGAARVRRLRQRSGWAQGGARTGGGGARPAASASRGCRDARSRAAAFAARAAGDWLAAPRNATTRRSRCGARSASIAGGVPALRSVSGRQRAPTGRRCGCWLRAPSRCGRRRCTPRTEVGSCCSSAPCTGGGGVPVLARAVRRGRLAAQQVLGRVAVRDIMWA